MSIPNHVTALANHKGAAIVHAGGMLIPVKIMDISHEETLTASATAFKCLVVDANCINPAEVKRNLNSVYGRQGAHPSERYASCFKNDDGPRGGFTLPHGGKFTIDHVLFNGPATIVFWKNGDKTTVLPGSGSETVVSCQEGDVWSKETGLFAVIAKKMLGNKGNFNDVFKKHIPEY